MKKSPHSMIIKAIISLSTLATSAIYADEGQWQPYQLKQLQPQLKKLGIRIPVENLTDLTKHPMSAMVNVDGCSASFVSPQGLIVTNHHCAFGAIQRNSTAQKNYIKEGFLAKTLNEELPGGADLRVYVTQSVENVTQDMIKDIPSQISGRERREIIQTRIKNMIAECEQDKSLRCSVPSFHRGLEYYRIKQLAIRDVRLVYAPTDMVGDYGKDIDNFEYPRHSGDFAFYRAYVGKDGQPADPSPNNVPYSSKDFLTISAEGLKKGDPILLAGYPGRTNRYKLPAEVRFARDYDYPNRAADMLADIQAIEKRSENHPDYTVKYASIVKGINNRLKKLQGMIAGFARKDIAAIKEAQEKEFRQWFSKQSPEKAQALFKAMDDVILEDMRLSQEEFAYQVATTSDLLSAARTLYRLALEKEKDNSKRDAGFQERDIPLIQARLTRLEQSFVPEVDVARYSAALQRYQKLDLPTQPQGLTALLPQVDALAGMMAKTQLSDTQQRLNWIGKSKTEFENTQDPYIQLAVKLQTVASQLDNRRKECDGKLDWVIPQYMQALIAFKQSQGKPVYPDANSTLRITYGVVDGYKARDALYKTPFTVIEGIAEKHTGKDPYIAPSKILQAIKEKRYGNFYDAQLGSVPVNFLSSADTTGGNSGSAIVNKNGHLIGLNFDSTFESITKDWYFDPEITRAVHVDIRYMLWVMKEIDGADNLLKEMHIRYPQKPQPSSLKKTQK